MKVKSMMVRVGADTKDMERGLKTAQAKMKAFGNQIKKIGKVMAVAGAAIVGALAMMVRSYVKAGDEIHKMALRTGFSTEALSELKYAAEISGASLDDLEKAVKKMSKTISDASKAGGALATYVRAFDRIGLSAEDLIALSPEEQFDRITRAIAELESPTLRAALAQEIFGRAGTKLLPLMAEGAEGLDKLRKKAEELGLVWSQEAANAAAKLNDSITTLKGSFTGLSRSLVTKLVPAITVVADHFTETFVGLQEESKTLASMIVSVFGAMVGAVGGTLIALKGFYISMIMLNKMLAEGLIGIVEAIELTAIHTGKMAIIMKVVPWTAEAIEKLNKVRELNIELIKEEEGELLKLMDFFKELQQVIELASRAEKTFGRTITESVLPPARELVDVFGKLEGLKLPPVAITMPKFTLETEIGTEEFETFGEWYKAWVDGLLEKWQTAWQAALSGARDVLGALSGVFSQFHENEAMRIDNEEKKKTEALESWYEQEKAKIEATITDEEDLAEALAALEEKKAEKQAALQEKIDKERRKLERKRAKAQKAGGLFAAGINMAEAITKAFTAGPIIGKILAVATAALCGIQIAAIAAAPLPALQRGGRIEKAAIVGEAGPELFVPGRPGMIIPLHREARAEAFTFSPTINIYAKYLDDRTIDRAAEKIFARLEMEKERYT